MKTKALAIHGMAFRAAAILTLLVSAAVSVLTQ